MQMGVTTADESRREPLGGFSFTTKTRSHKENYRSLCVFVSLW
jgi:hypothetical protein